MPLPLLLGLSGGAGLIGGLALGDAFKSITKILIVGGVVYVIVNGKLKRA